MKDFTVPLNLPFVSSHLECINFHLKVKSWQNRINCEVSSIRVKISNFTNMLVKLYIQLLCFLRCDKEIVNQYLCGTKATGSVLEFKLLLNIKARPF